MGKYVKVFDSTTKFLRLYELGSTLKDFFAFLCVTPHPCTKNFLRVNHLLNVYKAGIMLSNLSAQNCKLNLKLMPLMEGQSCHCALMGRSWDSILSLGGE